MTKEQIIEYWANAANRDWKAAQDLASSGNLVQALFFAHLVIEKGSIAVNGTSLTCFDITNSTFRVAIIPYTFEHTTFRAIVPGSIVNIEFDILGKYIVKQLDRRL